MAQAAISSGGLVVVTLLFALIISCQRAAANEAPARQYRWRPLRLLSQLLRRLAEGMRGIPAFASLYPAFLLSFVFVLLEMLSFWLVMVGYGLALSFWAGAAVYLIIRLGTMIPNAPANVGAYQFFCVVGLKLFGVEKTLATGFSLVVFVLLTLPLLVIGFIALSRSGTTLFAIREEVSKLMNTAPPLKTELEDFHHRLQGGGESVQGSFANRKQRQETERSTRTFSVE